MIEVGSFSGLKSLYEINMGENDTISLKANMFTGLESVETISLYRNKIQAIEDRTFNDLDKLKTLYIFQNNISELSEEMFTGLISLQTLHLEGNKLITISADAFSQLFRPFALILSNPNIPASQRNALQCSTNLCWLEQDEAGGTITFRNEYRILLKPSCSNGGDWNTLVCNSEGRFRANSFQ